MKVNVTVNKRTSLLIDQLQGDLEMGDQLNYLRKGCIKTISTFCVG